MQAGVFDRGGNGLHLGQRLGARLGLLRGRGSGRIAGDIILQLLALGLLLGARRLLLGQPFGALALERVIAAGIKGHLPAFEMQDIVNHIVEQIALMADDDHGAAIGLKEILQPQGRFEIEMVRRFVEQQQIRVGEEQSGERHAHLPAARIAVERTALHFLVETEANEDAGGARGRGIGIDRGQPLIDMAEAIGVFGMLRLRHQCGAFLVGGEHGVERGRGARGGFLCDIAEAGVARHVAAALVRVQLADHHLHQGRLACAIAADEADAAARRQRGAGAVEDGAAAQAHGDTVQVKHGRACSRAAAGGEAAWRACESCKIYSVAEDAFAPLPVRGHHFAIGDFCEVARSTRKKWGWARAHPAGVRGRRRPC